MRRFRCRATTLGYSVARQCLPANDIPGERFREVEFTMESDRDLLCEHYAILAETIAANGAEQRHRLSHNRRSIHLPIDTYTLAALKDCLPELRHRTYPGVTSYCAVAAATESLLGRARSAF
jgi:precorrin-2/cobalt-factor-2 C20-methyltransferase